MYDTKRRTREGHRFRQRGFTLQELVVSLAIGGGVTTGAAGLYSMVQDAQVVTETNEIVAHMNLARSEAITRGYEVALCANGNADCRTRTGEISWQNGYRIYANTDGDNCDDAREAASSNADYQVSAIDLGQMAQRFMRGEPVELHQVMAAGQGALMASTPLTLAETASVFGEMLTFQALLRETKEPKKRHALLASKVEDMLNTVVRQIAFYTLERKVHLERREGELTAERLGELWLEVQTESLGPAIRLGPGYETFWTYIPHFIHSPFYVYAYAFGDCLVNSLYARYRESAAGFQEKYFAMLKAGGSKHHKELLQPFGLDAADPQFWHKGLAVISGMIDELEAADRV